MFGRRSSADAATADAAANAAACVATVSGRLAAAAVLYEAGGSGG